MLWVKAFHVIAVVTWFAGLFYLPRLYVYHAMAEDEIGRERFKVMERKLYYGITWPSMIAVVGLGLWLTLGWHLQSFVHEGWLHVKLVLVALLMGYHLYCGHLLKAFSDDRNRHGHVFYRWLNEAPVLVLVAAVLLAVLRPF